MAASDATADAPLGGDFDFGIRSWWRDLMAASTQLRAAMALVVATAVTLIVIVPLAYRAFDARDGGGRPLSAGTDGIDVIAGETASALEGTVLQGEALVAVTVEGTEAIAYRIVDADGVEVDVGLDEFGPDFTLRAASDGRPAPFDTSELDDGTYTIFVTLTIDGDEAYRMAGFEIANQS